jgi:hypothetical protein
MTKKSRRSFNLTINNGKVVLPNVMTAEEVAARLAARSGGYMHIVAYTDAKALKKARVEGMDLVKITDVMCINGLPKREEAPSGNGEEKKRPEYFSRLNYSTIQYYKDGSKAITPHLTNNPKHIGKSYYVDKNSKKVYEKQFLIENGYISTSAANTRDDEDIKWVSFKFDKIILIK